MSADNSKDNLVGLIRQSMPEEHLHNHPLLLRTGAYIGGALDEWDWFSDELRRLTIEELTELHNLVKQKPILDADGI